MADAADSKSASRKGVGVQVPSPAPIPNRRTTMRKLALLIAAALPLLTQAALAQTAGEGTPTRVTGTIEKLDGNALTVETKDAGKLVVTLTAEAKVYGVEKRRLADVKPGDFVASGGVRGTDGKIHAVELRIFPE